MFPTKWRKKYNKKIKNIKIEKCRYFLENKKNKIFVYILNINYFTKNFDDCNILYKIPNKNFYTEFKFIKGEQNCYIPINFKTKNECKIFLNKIGIKKLKNGF